MTELFEYAVTLLSYGLLLFGLFFFVAGTVGVLRFPDVYCRLHALTKADTLGLGLVVLGLSLQAPSVQAVSIMVLIWLLIMASGATVCQLLARFAKAQAHGSNPPESTRDSTREQTHGR